MTTVDSVTRDPFGFSLVADDCLANPFRCEEGKTIAYANKIVLKRDYHAIHVCSIELSFLETVFLCVDDLEPFKVDVSAKVALGKSSIQKYRAKRGNESKDQSSEEFSNRIHSLRLSKQPWNS